MERHYFAVVTGYTTNTMRAFLPDFPELELTAGDPADLIRKATDALQRHIDDLAKQGQTPPEPRSPKGILTGYEDEEYVWVQAIPTRPAGKRVRINITIDERLLNFLDGAASASGMSRSAFFAEAGRAYVMGGH